MLVLAADTSGEHGSIALAHGHDDGSCTVIETVALEGGAFSAQLVPRIASLLKNNGFEIRDIGAFAAVSGPGSFTGLRVGLAAIKALAEALEKPIAPVSLLEVIATAGKCHGKILAAVNAGRQRLYLGEFDVSETHSRPLRELVLTGEEFSKLDSSTKVVTPDLEVSALASAFTIQIIPRPKADSVARAGWLKILSGATVLPEALEANYMGHADADLFSNKS